MNLRKTYKEFKDLRKRMIDPTEEQLKDYYNAVNFLGVTILKYEDNIGVFNNALHILQKHH